MRLYVENGTNYIKSLDDGSPIKLQVIDNDSSPIDLTAFSKIVVKIGNENGTILNITPDSFDIDGFVSFTMPKNTLNAGKYQIEVYMYTVDEKIRVAPSDSILPFSVYKALDEVGVLVNVMALDEILSKVNETVLSSNEAVKLANNSMLVSDMANTKSNEANVKSDKAVLDSTNAVATANQANTKSDEAIATANSTIAKSDKAVLDSTNALNKSNEANTKSDKAVLDSGNALTKATESVETSNSANTKSDKAVLDSGNALTIANESKTSSLEANTKSDNAVLKSNEANAKSDKAILDSANAVTVSNQANIKSDNAITLATQSDTKSTNAETVALGVESRFNEIISGNTNAEVVNARGTFTTLTERLDDSDTKLNNKVNMEIGKGLSTNDYTTTEKNKLAGLENTTVSISLESTSTTSAASSSAIKTVNDSLNAFKSETTTNLGTKVDKVTGKGLSTNDFTNDDKLNLDNLKLEGLLNQVASGVDANGVYTTITYKRANATNYLVSTASLPNSDGNYTKVVWQFYGENGTTLLSTKTWTITYDANGVITKKEVV